MNAPDRGGPASAERGRKGLFRSSPTKVFARAIRDADRAPTAESTALRLAAIRELRRADPTAHEPVLAQLPVVARAVPGQAMWILSEVLDPPVMPITEPVRVVLAAWIQCPDDANFSHTWDLFWRACDDLGVDPLMVLSAAGLPARSSHGPAPGPVGPAPDGVFRARAARLLLARLDDQPFPAAVADQATWRAFLHVAPADAPDGLAHWWYLLAEAAARRGDLDEARARYSESARLGDPSAGTALAHLLATRARDQMRQASWAQARRLLDEALRHADLPEYRLLRAIGEILGGPRPAPRLIDQLGLLEKPSSSPGFPSEVAFWSAVCHLRGGAAPAPNHADTIPDDGSERALAGRIVAAARADDGAALAAAVSRLRRAHGPGWVQACPLTPAYVLGAVARSDPELFEVLLGDAPPAVPWRKESTAIAAHGLLAAAVTAIRESRPDDARRLLATPLLAAESHPWQ